MRSFSFSKIEIAFHISSFYPPDRATDHAMFIVKCYLLLLIIFTIPKISNKITPTATIQIPTIAIANLFGCFIRFMMFCCCRQLFFRVLYHNIPAHLQFRLCLCLQRIACILQLQPRLSVLFSIHDCIIFQILYGIAVFIFGDDGYQTIGFVQNRAKHTACVQVGDNMI